MINFNKGLNQSMQREESARLRYSACHRLALLKFCRDLGLKGVSSLSKSQLIASLIDSNQPLPAIQLNDLSVHLRPFFGLITGMAGERERAEASREKDLLRQKIILTIGNSLSRLPYLAHKDDHSDRDWLIIRTISLNLDALHDLLETAPLCETGKIIPYNSLLHDGPTGIQEGDPCFSVSTGIQSKESVIVKAIVERVAQ